MMTKDQISLQIGDYVDVMPTETFLHCVEDGTFINYDGVGFFHNGEYETNIQARCDVDYLSQYVGIYPYVCWYGR